MKLETLVVEFRPNGRVARAFWYLNEVCCVLNREIDLAGAGRRDITILDLQFDLREVLPKASFI